MTDVSANSVLSCTGISATLLEVRDAVLFVMNAVSPCNSDGPGGIFVGSSAGSIHVFAAPAVSSAGDNIGSCR